MATTTEMVIPALREVRETQAAVVERFQAHIAVTPEGAYRRVLQRGLDDAQEHIDRLDQHIEQMRPHGLLEDTLDRVRYLAGRATRVARLPLDMVTAVPMGVLWGRRKVGEQQVLKNAEDDYGLTAKVVATCRAGERIARGGGDPAGAELLGSIRRREEDLLNALGGSIEQWAETVVAAEAEGRPAYRVGATGAAQAARAGADRLLAAAETTAHRAAKSATEVAQRVPGAPQVWGEVKGALAEEERLPIRNYDNLSAYEIVEQLPRLSQTELSIIEGYERAHAGRTTILNKIAELRSDEPWPGYDTMSAEEIRARLRDGDPELARRVVDYERRHRARTTVITAAERVRT